VLFERYHQPLYRYCRSIVRNEADAQDALQSTFAAALSALKRSQRNAPLRPWLFRIAHNEAIGVIRRRTRDSADELSDSVHQIASSAEEEATDRARWATLVADLADLPERARAALLLRELNGLSHQDIAIALGTSIGGAKQAIFEARQALFELSEGRAMKCEEVRTRISDGDRRVLRGRAVRAHLRDCAACGRFADSIGTRTHELRAYAPVLAPAASIALLERALHGGLGHGHALASSSSFAGGAAVGGAVPASTVTPIGLVPGSSAAAGAVGKAAAATIASKVLAAAAVVATAGVGVVGVRALDQPSSPVTTGSPASVHTVSGGTGAGHRAHGAQASSTNRHHGNSATHARSNHAASTSHAGGRSASASRAKSSAHRASGKSTAAVRRSSRSHSSSHRFKAVRTNSNPSGRLTASRQRGNGGSAGGHNHPSSTATARPVHSSGSLNVAGVNVPLPVNPGQAVKIGGK
jgi:RNA polymerase sigma factor (sigma-70 family)